MKNNSSTASYLELLISRIDGLINSSYFEVKFINLYARRKDLPDEISRKKLRETMEGKHIVYTKIQV